MSSKCDLRAQGRLELNLLRREMVWRNLLEQLGNIFYSNNVKHVLTRLVSRIGHVRVGTGFSFQHGVLSSFCSLSLLVR